MSKVGKFRQRRKEKSLVQAQLSIAVDAMIEVGVLREGEDGVIEQMIANPDITPAQHEHIAAVMARMQSERFGRVID